MRCGHTRRQFSRYLDGGLDGAAAAALEAHVERCAACREELARWRLLSGALRGSVTEVPVGLAERSWRAAMAAEVAAAPAPAPWGLSMAFLDRFLPVAARTAMVGAAATALIWAGLLIGGAPGGDAGVASADPMEMAMAVWAEAPYGD
jgi:anti-sigma factor RsiW